MKIPEFGTLQMTRTDPAHTGTAKLSDIAGSPLNDIPSAAEKGAAKTEERRQDQRTAADRHGGAGRAYPDGAFGRYPGSSACRRVLSLARAGIG